MGDPVENGGTAPPPLAADSIPVVAIGASAGGLEPMQRLLAHLPTTTGMAIVVIQHLDPNRPSMLAKVLEGSTGLPVVEARSGMTVAPDRVHVIPSTSDLAIQRGVLTLVRREKTGSLHLPIDSFLRSLAEDGKGRAIGVILSGAGADGTEGLRAIKADGGLTIAQTPSSAQFSSMPENAIHAGVVDFQGTPEEIASELTRLAQHPYVTRDAETSSRDALDEGQGIEVVFARLRHHVGTDFSRYKRKTVVRRIQRRMTLRHTASLDEYSKLLQDEPAEAQALARDMLIHVTSFFRDPEAFATLEEVVLPELVRRSQAGKPIRIWVPGCSTGEEAYSLAMALVDAVGDGSAHLSIQIFGTDLSNAVIEVARRGIYPESTLAGVPPDRLARYFDRSDGSFRISKRIRDLCIFVKHDILHDPPFAKLDLVSCRNVLIYFDAELQHRVVPLLHYCLNARGYLFLGQSETITGFRDLFAPVDQKHRIFVKTGDSRHLIYPVPTSPAAEVTLGEDGFGQRRHASREAQKQADRLLLARYTPPGVIVNDRFEVLQFRGRTGAYLEPPPGRPQTNLLRMLREGLAAHAHDAMERAKSQGTTVRKERLRLHTWPAELAIDLEVVPLAPVSGSSERYFLILFVENPEEDVSEAGATPPRGEHAAQARPAQTRPADEMERLETELIATKDYLQSLVSDHLATTDDLAATNEELVAANEELQSTNEELQSAKEELQSTNEELSTVNDQLRHRNQELDQIADDLANILSSVEIPIIIVDLGLRVRRFTPALSDVASFIPEDVGRQIDDIKLRIDVTDLADRIRSVIECVEPREWEVKGPGDRWFRMQIRPYRTTSHRLDGAVLSFVDVDTLKRARQDAEGARDYARAIVETVTTALLVLDSRLQVVSANGAFFDAFALNREAVEERRLFDLSNGVWAAPELRHALETALDTGLPFTALELTAEVPPVGPRVFSLSGRSIQWSGAKPMVLLAIDDVTELRVLERERAQLLASERQARVSAEQATRAKDVFLAVLSHELRTPLSTILMSAQLLEQLAGGDSRVARASASIRRAARAQARLIDDLLDVSRIVSGKLILELGPVDFAAIVQDAVDIARPSAQAKSLDLELSIEEFTGTVYGDSARLQQVVNNLLSNSIKFTPHGGRISVHLERRGDRAELTVVDTGMGIAPEVLPHLFSRFVQADSSVTRTHGGLGLGLAIVRHLIESHGGEVQAESEGDGRGATFRITLPVSATGSTDVSAHQRRAHTHAIDGVRVLLLDDDDDTREAYSLMLAELGAEVRAVPSAADALAALEEFRPRVILSDIAMPGEDGFSFIRQVRRLAPERCGQVPAAAVTALASDEDRQRALHAGFQIHLAKPVDAMQLASVVRRLADWKPREAP